MALRNQLGELYVKVIADVSSAIADSEKLLDAYVKQTEGLKKQGEAAKKVHEDIAKRAKINVKDRDRILRDRKLDKVISKEKLKEIDKEIKAREKAAKKVDILLDRHRVYNDLVQKHLANKLIKFRDFSGRIDEQDAATFNRYQQEKLANYESFLKRAGNEHSRFVTRLDQRDMTASTIENMRRGFEKGVITGAKWHKDENQIQRVARGIGMAAGSLRKMKDDSQMALSAFQTFQRVGYALQSALGVLGGTIGSLGGGLLALVGVAGQAAYSLIAVGSAFASMGAGMIAAKIALGGVGQAVTQMLDPQKKLQGALRNTRRELRNLRFDAEESALSQEEAAINLEKAREELARVQDLPPDSRVRRETELQFQQAELNYRRAKARNKEAREDLKKGPAGSGTVDPLAALTKSQKDFAKYLVTLKPLMDQLKEAAASGFLPILQTSIQTLVDKAFPTLESGLNTLGTAMGNASKSFADAFTTPENLELLQEFFKNSKPIIEAFGRVLGNVLGGVLGTLKAAQPLTDRFTKWVEKSSESFENWGKGSGLRDFLNLAGDVAASLGSVFKTVFGGLKNVLDATFPGGDVNAGAGGILLQWLQKLADGFKAFTGSSEFAGWLQVATANATTAVSSIGTLLKPLFDIASMPEIGEFWTVLRGAAEPIKKLLEDGAKAAPEFAAMLVSVINLFAQFSDSGALEGFFNTLNQMATIISEYILKPLKPVLDFIGRIHGVFLAIGLAIIVFKSVFMVLAGITKTVFLTVGKTAAVMNSVAARVYATATQFDTLRRSGLGAGGAVKQLAAEIYSMNRAAVATREQSKMLQMAKDAGMAKKQVKELRDKIDEVIIAQQKLGFKGRFDNKFIMNEAVGMMGPPINPKTGKPYGKNTKTAQVYREELQQRTQAVAGGDGYQPKYARNRMMTGARAASGVGGAALMLGSMGSTGGSALTTGLGMASMVSSFLPGPLGLISSAVLGIGSAISSGFDAAAQAEKDRKSKIEAQKLEVIAKEATIKVEKERKFSAEALGYMESAGLSKGQAAAAVIRENAQAKALVSQYGVTGTTTADGKEVSAVDVVAGFRTALGESGYTSAIAKDTKSSNKMIEAMISLSKTMPGADPSALAAVVASAFKKSGMSGLEAIIKDKNVVYTDTAGNQQYGTAEEANAQKIRTANMKGANEALTLIAPKLQSLSEAFTLGSKGGIGKPVVKGSNMAAVSDSVVEKLNEAGFDWSNVSEGREGSYNVKQLKAEMDRQKAAMDKKVSELTNLSSTGIYAGGSALNPMGSGARGTSDIFTRGQSNLFKPPGVSAAVAAAPTGPTGKVGDEINVNDPNTKGLLPVLTKLANATPNVMVVNVKNKSELDALYRKLGLPSVT